jgi:AcrR family transcriptional regulator
MEAATTAKRELSSDKAARIVEAMRASVAARGAVGSTFDHVAREAGVSRGLLHYYFGTKERLLVEVVKRHCEVTHDQIEEAVGAAASGDEVVTALVSSYQHLVLEDASTAALHFELLTLAQRNAEIAAELAEMGRLMRSHLAQLLSGKQQEGVLSLHGEPEDVAGLLFALADGLTMRHLTEPHEDMSSLMALVTSTARAMLV